MIFCQFNMGTRKLQVEGVLKDCFEMQPIRISERSWKEGSLSILLTENGKRHHIGTISITECYAFDIYWESTMDIADAIEGQMFNFFDAIAPYKEQERELLTPSWWDRKYASLTIGEYRRILYIQKIEIKEKYRGHKYGHTAISGVLDYFAYQPLMAVLKCESELHTYYRKIGFHVIQKHPDFMYKVVKRRK